MFCVLLDHVMRHNLLSFYIRTMVAAVLLLRGIHPYRRLFPAVVATGSLVDSYGHRVANQTLGHGHLLLLQNCYKYNENIVQIPRQI